MHLAPSKALAEEYVENGIARGTTVAQELVTTFTNGVKMMLERAIQHRQTSSII